jgi:hypothetical protein
VDGSHLPPCFTDKDVLARFKNILAKSGQVPHCSNLSWDLYLVVLKAVHRIDKGPDFILMAESALYVVFIRNIRTGMLFVNEQW